MSALPPISSPSIDLLDDIERQVKEINRDARDRSRAVSEQAEIAVAIDRLGDLLGLGIEVLARGAKALERIAEGRQK